MHQHHALHILWFVDAENGGKAGSVDISSRDPFEYLAACHIGHHVEVHLKDGSVYGGVFHAADVENSFGEGTL